MSQYTGSTNEISLQGFQIVRGQMFNRQLEPTMSIRKQSIAFNKACYATLQDCSSIHIMVNSAERKIIIRPCPSSDRDAVAWVHSGKTIRQKPIECSRLTEQLYTLWGFDKRYRYRTNGRVVFSEEKVMLLFDFANPEIWNGQKMVSDSEL